MSLDPAGWIDQQRQAGDARGNVFADILAAAHAKRSASGDRAALRELASTRRVQHMRERSARLDAHVEATAFGPIPRDVL